MRFAFDENKSQSNLEKHGIDFRAVQELWNDPDLLQLQARTENELRFVLIGRIACKHWSVVITYREETVRIISARRARNKEVLLYESQRI